MGNHEGVRRAVVVLVVGDRAVPLGRVDRRGRCDLGLVEDILRLRLAARRFGWEIRLIHVHPDLLELVELMGLGDCLLPGPDRSC